MASVASLTVTAESGGASVSTARMSGGGFSGLSESCNLSVRQAKLLSKKRAAEELELARYTRCTSDNCCYPKHDLLLRFSDVAAYNIKTWHDITAIKEMIMMCHWLYCSTIHLQLSCNSYWPKRWQISDNLTDPIMLASRIPLGQWAQISHCYAYIWLSVGLFECRILCSQ